MSNNPVPVYLVDLHSSDKSHIVVGKEIETLCGKNDVSSAIQIPDDVEPKNYILEKGLRRELCKDCLEEWNEIKYKIFREPTETCMTCKNITSGHVARKIEHSSAGEGPICKVCYEEIQRHPDSHIDTPYEQADPYREAGSRTYNADN